MKRNPIKLRPGGDVTRGDAEIKTVANFQIRGWIVIPGPGDVFILFAEPRPCDGN